MVIIACSIPACWPLAVHLFRKARKSNSSSNNNNNNTWRMGPDNHRTFPLQGGSYHVSAEGHKAVGREDPLLEYEIMVRKDLSVQEEVKRDVSTPGLGRKSSAEDETSDAISAAERV